MVPDKEDVQAKKKTKFKQANLDNDADGFRVAEKDTAKDDFQLVAFLKYNLLKLQHLHHSNPIAAASTLTKANHKKEFGKI